MIRKFSLPVIFFAITVSAYAQSQNALLTSDYARAEQLLSYNVVPYVDHESVRPNWISNDHFWFRDMTADGSDFILIDPEKGTRKPAFDQQKLAASISKATGRTYSADNLPFQYDFRSVYSTILANWLCVKDEDLQQIMLKNYQILPLVNAGVCKKAVNLSGETLISNYPNPFTTSTIITFTTTGGHTLIQVIDTTGRVVKNLLDKEYGAAGTYTVTFDGSFLQTGVYYARLQNLSVQQVRAMIKAR